MLKTLLTVSSVILLSACASNGSVKGDNSVASPQPQVTSVAEVEISSKSAENFSDEITVLADIPYKKGSKIALNIRQECHITRQLSEFTQSYAKEEGIKIVRAPRLDESSEGKNLKIEITEAVSQGNAWIGHRKYTSIEGELYDNGKKVSGFTATRLSGGGFFGGYKGSCSVLGRTAEVLGKDVAGWLKSPVDGVHLGDYM